MRASARQLAALFSVVCAAAAFLPDLASADVPGLKATPVQYEDQLVAGHIKNGYIDVSNPGDGHITLESSVRGFRQTGTDGRLEFFEDADLAAAIKVDLTDFDLGPREAARVGFSVDPAKLPAGGIYAVIFFRTVPPQQSAGSSYVSESANIGTLLILTNGPDGPHQGTIATAQLPFWQFGSGLTGSLDYTNTDRSAHPRGFRPSLTVQAVPWGAAPRLDTGLVLPGVTRHFRIARPGSYFGLLPVTITDTDTHRTTTRWIFACTGWCPWLLLLLLFVLFLPVRVLKVLKRRPQPAAKRPLDGLSPKK